MNKLAAIAIILGVLPPLIFILVDYTFVLYRRWFKGEDAV